MQNLDIKQGSPAYIVLQVERLVKAARVTSQRSPENLEAQEALVRAKLYLKNARPWLKEAQRVG